MLSDYVFGVEFEVVPQYRFADPLETRDVLSLAIQHELGIMDIQLSQRNISNAAWDQKAWVLSHETRQVMELKSPPMSISPKNIEFIERVRKFMARIGGSKSRYALHIHVSMSNKEIIAAFDQQTESWSTFDKAACLYNALSPKVMYSHIGKTHYKWQQSKLLGCAVSTLSNIVSADNYSQTSKRYNESIHTKKYGIIFSALKTIEFRTFRKFGIIEIKMIRNLIEKLLHPIITRRMRKHFQCRVLDALILRNQQISTGWFASNINDLMDENYVRYDDRLYFKDSCFYFDNIEYRNVKISIVSSRECIMGEIYAYEDMHIDNNYILSGFKYSYAISFETTCIHLYLAEIEF